MPVNPYDDRKVSLRRPHRNGDLDIVLASYTRRKANVTEALHKETCAFMEKAVLLLCYIVLYCTIYGVANGTLHCIMGTLRCKMGT